MALKTNKSYQKRLKVTKTGKILVRKAGQNHFNSKEGRQDKAVKNKSAEFHMTQKERSRFLVNL